MTRRLFGLTLFLTGLAAGSIPGSSQRSGGRRKTAVGVGACSVWRRISRGRKVHPNNPGEWKVEEGFLVGSGPVSHLFTDRDDYENFHFRIEARINEKGNSGQYFRTRVRPGVSQGLARPRSIARTPIPKRPAACTISPR